MLSMWHKPEKNKTVDDRGDGRAEGKNSSKDRAGMR